MTRKIMLTVAVLAAFALAQEPAPSLADRGKEAHAALKKYPEDLKEIQDLLAKAEAQFTRIEKAYGPKGRGFTKEKVVFTMGRLERMTARSELDVALESVDAAASRWQALADDVTVKLEEMEGAKPRNSREEEKLRAIRKDAEDLVEGLREFGSLHRQIRDVRLRSLNLLLRNNLLLRGQSRITSESIATGLRDIGHLPAWIARTARTTGSGGWWSLLIGIAVAFGIGTRVPSRYRLALLLLAVPVLASFLLTELPAGAPAWLRAMGLVLAGVALLHGLHLGLTILVWVSAACLPFLIGMEAFGYENRGMVEFCWLVYEGVIGLVIVVMIARGHLLRLLPEKSLLQSCARWAQPLLMLAVPALLVLDAMSFDLLAGLATRLLAGVFAAVVVAVLLNRAGRALVEKRLRRRAALDGARFLLAWLAFALGVEVFLRVTDSDMDQLRAVLGVPLPLATRVTYWNLVVGAIVLTFFLSGTGRAKTALRDLVLKRSRMSQGLQYTLTQLFGYVMIATGFYFAVTQVLDLSNLGYILAALSVGLGFGLQEIVSNFVSGLILLFERPLRVGDMIEVGGVRGEVKQINIRATTVLTQDNVYLLVPNREFIAQTVVNNGHVDPKVRVHVAAGVSYGSDVPLVRRVLEEVAAAHQKVLREPAPEVRFIEFADSSINFELLVWIQHAPDRDRIKSDLIFAIFEKFAEHDIEIPFPQRDLHIKSGPAVELAS